MQPIPLASLSVTSLDVQSLSSGIPFSESRSLLPSTKWPGKMEAVPRVELGSPDSESGVITTTLHSRHLCFITFSWGI